MSRDVLAELRQTFFEECDEQLVELESGLLRMQEGEDDADLVNAVFRAVHSVKGGAGAFELETLVAFAHAFETLLDEIRSDRLTPGPEMMKAMLRASDVLADLVSAARAGEEVAETVWKDLAEEIAAFSRGETPGPAAAPAPDPAPEVAEPEASDAFQPMKLEIAPLAPPVPDAPVAQGSDVDVSGDRRFLVMFRPHPGLYANGADAVVLLRELERLGEMQVECDLSEVPALDALDPLSACLSFTVTLGTHRGEADIRDVFEFCDQDCDLLIRQAPAQPEAAVEPAAQAPRPSPIPAPQPSPQATPVAVQGAAQIDTDQPFRPEPVTIPMGPIPSVADASEAAGAPAQAARADDAAARAPTPAAATIRVDLDRVDRLINLVGELVINQAMLSQAVLETESAKNPSVAGGLDELDQLTREIQESVMAIRAQPLKPLFQRMSRIVRELADATGKQVRLVAEGEWTEVDKTVVERLADPLTHMIRNAIDHGLETPEARKLAGKDPEGVVKLSAAHRSGRVVIEVSDDGAGVNREKVRKIAVDKGLVAADAPLSDAEVDNLLFLPGFSTVDKVSNISGRGVGMDVVKKSIHSLSGRILLKSWPGRGSVFTMSLPLTLAVLDGMVVTVGDQTLVAPLSAIVETMSLDGDRVRALGDSGSVIRDRDGFAPIVDTAAELGFRAPRRPGAEGERGVALLVETEGGVRSALVVDAIQDQRQVVIKSLETNYGRVPGVAAATILGDGRVALILDVDMLVARARGDAPEPMMTAAE